jgi:potassium-dependent mechanosensitive channel
MRFARFGRACTVVLALLVPVGPVLVGPILAAPAPSAGAPAPPAEAPRIAAQITFDDLKRRLDRITLDSHGDRLSEDELAAQRRELQRVRDEVRAEIERLEPRLAEAETRLSQLGPAPAAGEPPEDATIAADRARLTRLRNNLDTALKQGRLLAVQGDQLAERISQYRRRAFLRELFARTESALDPAVWRGAATAAGTEVVQLNELAQTWWSYARNNGGLLGTALAILASAGAIAVGMLALRWSRRRAMASPTDTRFTRMRASLAVLLRNAAATPLAVGFVVIMLEACGLMPEAVASLGYGLVAAVAVAAFGRAVAIALLAPTRAERRLVDMDDAVAQRVALGFVWAARAFGLGIFLNLMHRALGAPAVLATETNGLVDVVIAALLVSVLLRGRLAGEPSSVPYVQWLRVAGWVIAAMIAISLFTGHAPLATFLASRAVIVPTILGALYIAAHFVDQLFAAELSADSERGRRIAAWFGLSPRGLELVGTILSAVIRVLLIIAALVPLFARWGMSAADLLDVFEGALFGFRVGEITISFAAISSALVLVLLGILLTRIIQRWLGTQVLPRTALEPGLQNSISALIGYAGLIAVVSLGLATLGIDLQKIALVAGALSVGIGFGLQSVVSNFVSGIILLAERPIRVGDIVEVKGESGWVRKISVRATEIETFERASMIVPNSALISDVVKNWTHGNPTSRIIVKIGVAYDSDPEQVRAILNEVAAAHPLVLTSPPPRVLFARFGDSALEFELRCVVANVDQSLNVSSDLHFTILKRFRAACIGIPYPQREVKIIGDKA